MKSHIPTGTSKLSSTSNCVEVVTMVCIVVVAIGCGTEFGFSEVEGMGVEVCTDGTWDVQLNDTAPIKVIKSGNLSGILTN